MLNRIPVVVFALTASLLSACTDQNDDELEADDATEGDASKADAPGGTYTYYFVKPDRRRCAPPKCGGVFYRLANAETTRCRDGSKGAQCYAASMDEVRLGLGDVAIAKVREALSAAEGSETQLLVRAIVGTQDWGSGLGSFASLSLSEAWIAQGPYEATGPLAKIEDTGVDCFTVPCESMSERKLNSSARASIAALGWDKSGVTSSAQIDDAHRAMRTTGLIVSGSRYTVSGAAGDAKARSVTQFWLRVTE